MNVAHLEILTVSNNFQSSHINSASQSIFHDNVNYDYSQQTDSITIPSQLYSEHMNQNDLSNQQYSINQQLLKNTRNTTLMVPILAKAWLILPSITSPTITSTTNISPIGEIAVSKMLIDEMAIDDMIVDELNASLSVAVILK
ncbi:hypothetical protein GLOIN_2v1791316 [Rhizophagus irregularis DAOM 181602=DAOM 197198]|nr:hypothetical protein GLOIN_2v1791316 [Rhizophagus irregularis DAOM 181602=DAOM 197198]